MHGEAGPRVPLSREGPQFHPIISSLEENKNEKKTGIIFETPMFMGPLLHSGLGWALGHQRQQMQSPASGSLVSLTPLDFIVLHLVCP